MPANLENSAVATGLEKVSFHSDPKEGNDKECSNYHTITLISHASKVMLKILQARLQQYGSINGVFQARVLEWGAIAFSVLTASQIYSCCSPVQWL